MNQRTMAGATALLAMLLSGCGGGGGAGSGTTTSTSLTSPSQLTVNVDSSCTMVPQSGYDTVTVAPASAPGTACAAGVAAAPPGSSQILVSIIYGTVAGAECPVNSALIVSTNTTNCGVLSTNYIPGQGSTVTLAPNASTALQQFVKTWTVNYQCSCGDSGSCNMPIVSTGLIAGGSCTDKDLGNFTVNGAVDASGNFNGTGSNGDVFSGTLNGTNDTGSGTWFRPSSNQAGAWTAGVAP